MLLWADLGHKEKKQLNKIVHAEGVVGLQYCSNAGAHRTVKEGTTSCNGQLSPPRPLDRGVWAGDTVRAHSTFWRTYSFYEVKEGVFLAQKGNFLVQSGVSFVQSMGEFSTTRRLGWYERGGILVPK